MNWGVSAAVHAALETPVPARAEGGTYETYPRSAIEEDRNVVGCPRVHAKSALSISASEANGAPEAF